jgi:hypothetical protein
MFSFVSCESDEIQREPSPEVAPGCQGVFFPATPSAFELEPTEPTEITLEISRRAKDAATVPLVAELNEQGVFVVPESVSFAAGDTTATIKVSFPGAKEGVTYILKLKVEGDAYVNQYASTVPYVQTSVTRIKWDDVKDGVMVEGILSTFFNIPVNYPFYVQMQKATLGSGIMYRLINPFRMATAVDEDGIYNGYPYNEPGDMVDGDYLMVISIDASDRVSMAPCELGMDWTYGMFSAGTIYGNVSTNSNYPLGIRDGDIIYFPPNSLYCSMAGYNNNNEYPATNPTTLYLTREAYIEANSNITNYNDVEFEVVAGAVSAFESSAFNEEWDQELTAAIDQKPDDAESPYKNLYYLPDLYSNGRGLAFYLNENKITIPSGQPTGTKFLDNDIYVSPSETLASGVETVSSTGLKTYRFGLNFHLEDGTSLGDFTETFYFSKNDIKRSINDFCGLFTLNATSGYDRSALEYPVKIDKVNDRTLKISGLLDPESATTFQYSNDAVYATFDATENCAVLDPQALQEKLVYQGVEYPVLFITYSSADDGLYDDQSIRIICRYNNVLKFTSQEGNVVPIDGFSYYALGAGAFDNIPYNVTLTPGAPATEPHSSIRSNKAPSMRIAPLKKGTAGTLLSKPETGTERKTLSPDNFSIRQKSNDKKRVIKPDLIPVF